MQTPSPWATNYPVSRPQFLPAQTCGCTRAGFRPVGSGVQQFVISLPPSDPCWAQTIRSRCAAFLFFTAEKQAGVLMAELLLHIQVYVLQWQPHCAFTAKLKKLKYHIPPMWPEALGLGGSPRKQAGSWVKACLCDLVFMNLSVQLKILQFSSETRKPPLSIFGPSCHHHLGIHILLGGQSPWILVPVTAPKQCFIMRLVEPLTGHSKHETLVKNEENNPSLQSHLRLQSGKQAHEFPSRGLGDLDRATGQFLGRKPVRRRDCDRGRKRRGC